MRKLLISVLLNMICVLAANASCGYEASQLEQAVEIRAKQNPKTAPEYFLQQIESGANSEEQAVYLYGMGLAHEKQKNTKEAINDYLSASILGNERAKCALMELQKIK